jgi:hypothetical protein
MIKQKTIQVMQNTDVEVTVTPTIAGESLDSLSRAKFVVYDRAENVLLEKELNAGITLEDGVVSVKIPAEETLSLPSSCRYELLIEANSDQYITMYGVFSVVKTVARFT